MTKTGSSKISVILRIIIKNDNNTCKSFLTYNDNIRIGVEEEGAGEIELHVLIVVGVGDRATRESR